MQSITIKDFEGPLDLLLQLIEARELSITQISLAEVTDQYLAALHERTDWDPDVLADFLVIAAKLILIKSKALLPTLDLGEEEQGAADLERQLKLYKEFLEASKTVEGVLRTRQVTYTRPPQALVTRTFTPPQHLTLATLRTIFESVLTGLESLLPLPQSVMKKTISIQEKIAQVRELIMTKVAMTFRTLLGSAQSKTDVIVSFLALLELVKQRVIHVRQETLFHDIHIEKQ